MAKFRDTYAAGKRAEGAVLKTLQQYTKFTYSNCRIDTLFTQQGVTELDIVSAIGDVILVVEVKNIRSIEGSITQQFWALEGAETGERYSALNILTQNRIHVRSLKDAWFTKNKKFPVVISVVVVPNNCWVPDDIRDGGVLTLTEFELQVAQLVQESPKNNRPKYGYALHHFLGSDGTYAKRADFK